MAAVIESNKALKCSYLQPNLRLQQLEKSSRVDIDPLIPIRRYYRSGQELLRMAVSYHEEGNLENAYTLYFKFMTLFLEEISKHPEYPAYSSELKLKNKKKCMSLLSIAEKVKKQLQQRYEAEHQVFLEQQAIAEQELKREQEELKRRKEEEEERQQLQHEQLDKPTSVASPFQEDYTPTPPPYSDRATDVGALYPSYGLDLPSAPQFDGSYSQDGFGTTPLIPARTLKPKPSGDVPSVDRSSKPSSLLGGTDGHLRRVRVPRDLIHRFMSLAQSNTARNTETCGILAGIMRQGELRVTHLLVPEQSGTPDSCTTRGEERLFDVQDKHDIITLGWIHTHPSQTAFLSSVDLHTHCSYQLMMPEAVAIVCAPKHNTTAVFTLTPEHGLPFIAGCKETGFHPHPSHPALFKEAEHVLLDGEGEAVVIDLRR